MCMCCHVPDVITCAKLQNEILMGCDSTGGQNFDFSIDFWITITTVQHYSLLVIIIISRISIKLNFAVNKKTDLYTSLWLKLRRLPISNIICRRPFVTGKHAQKQSTASTKISSVVSWTRLLVMCCSSRLHHFITSLYIICEHQYFNIHSFPTSLNAVIYEMRLQLPNISAWLNKQIFICYKNWYIVSIV